MKERPRDILHCIGNTSLLPLRNVAPESGARILLKVESENPTGSMKDRMALAMIEAAEADGRQSTAPSMRESPSNTSAKVASCSDPGGPSSAAAGNSSESPGASISKP